MTNLPSFGPLLFNIYTRPLGDVISNHGLDYQIYADDSEMYLAFKPKTSVEENHALDTLSYCNDDINDWMLENKLKKNDDKTDMVISTW